MLALEWVDGESLEAWNRRPDSPKDWTTLQRIALAIVDATSALHADGIFHRDLKTENIFITSDGNPKVMDLGIAECIKEDDVTMHTQLKDFIGSIRFASPQFVRGEKYQASDDIYSLGTVLFEIITGNRVYENVERKTLLAAEILRAPPPLPNLRDGVPPSLRTVVEGCLSSDRKRRPTISQLKDAIAQPEASQYVQQELDSQKREARGFRVIAIRDSGRSIFADLRGQDVSLAMDRIHSVVRRSSSIKVPSLGAEIEPEYWIADVRLKHAHNGVGHFVKLRKTWKSDNSKFGFMPSGNWVHEETTDGDVRDGDTIVPSD